MATGLVEGLSVVLLLARDTERTGSFYRDVLGLPLREEEHGGRHTHYACQLGTAYFTIQAATGLAAHQPGRGYDFLQLCFTVTDLDAFLQRLQDLKVTPLHPPQQFEHHIHDAAGPRRPPRPRDDPLAEGGRPDLSSHLTKGASRRAGVNVRTPSVVGKRTRLPPRCKHREPDMPKMPNWKLPRNITKALEDGDGFWEDERWSPILLIAMSGTVLDGREIPVAWQIEFDPSEEDFEAANAKLEEMGIDSDGYGWGEYIRKTIRKGNPALAKRLHLTDCETATCVIWVESDEDCRLLLEATWQLLVGE
jgi:catechol 2,3-dioxygenase-like lactoylglutathione lyase family enzyme